MTRLNGPTVGGAASTLNVGVRTRPGVDGRPVIVAAWCESCECEAMPLEDGRCGWCLSAIVDEWALLPTPALSVDQAGHVIRTHGIGGYARGCRCLRCYRANSDYRKQRYARAKGRAR